MGQNIGDISGGNYIEFNDDGSLRSRGDAVVWEDFRVAMNSLATIGIDAPPFKLFKNSGAAGTEAAIELDGSTQYGVVPNYTDINSDTLTYNMWIKPSSFVNNPSLISREGVIDIFLGSDKRVYVWIDDTEVISSNNLLIEDVKTMITLELIDFGSKIRGYLYINGVLDISVSINEQLPVGQTTAMYVGKYWDGTYYNFKGIIDELSIYNVRLTDAERQWLWNQGKGTNSLPSTITEATEVVAWFEFNEGAGTTVDNNCTLGAGQDITLYGAPTWVSGLIGTDVSGVFLRAFSPDTVQSVQFTIQMPHNWLIGTEVRPHVHWTSKTSTTGKAVVWKMEYTWVGVHGVFSDTTTISGSTELSSQTTANQHFYTNLTPITPSVTGVSSMCLCRLYRDTDDALDTLEDDAMILEFDLHYQKDSMGSFGEFTKYAE